MILFLPSLPNFFYKIEIKREWILIRIDEGNEIRTLKWKITSNHIRDNELMIVDDP